jgi:hypothetical protein
MMLDELATSAWPPPEAVQPVLRELYNHPAVIGATLQLIAVACVDMHATFKQQQQKWRQQKARLKATISAEEGAAADGKGKKKRGEGSSDAVAAATVAALAEASPLLKLRIPLDHTDAGVPAGWEQGLEPWRREDLDIVPGPQWTLAARVCYQAEAILRNHYLLMMQPDSWESVTHFLTFKESEELLSVHLSRLPVMKMLLETVFLLQATAPAVGVHVEVGQVLSMAVRDSPAEARELLRQRGLLLLQAMQLLNPDRGDEEEEGSQLWRQRLGMDNKPSSLVGEGFDWMESLIIAATGASEC